MLVGACALLAASCESSTQVGSDCRNGVCPRENLISSQGCVVSSTVAEITVTRSGDGDLDEGLGQVCLPRPLPADSAGRVTCRVLWLLAEAGSVPENEGTSPEQCSDLPFLEPAGPGYPPNACHVQQVTPEEAAASERDGWFYKGGDVPDCRSGQAVSYTRSAHPPSRVTVKVNCTRVQAAENGELVDVDATECGPLPDGNGDDVGDACLPSATPAGGFDDREAYVEARSNQCDTQACLVYRLRGDPSADCEADRDAGVVCATEGEVENRAYCSCRCDAPEGDPGELCECADGFSCQPALEDGPPGIRGSYCVRDGTFTGS